MIIVLAGLQVWRRESDDRNSEVCEEKSLWAVDFVRLLN
jgi:hypothetical protein